jgi:hypothetical protein
LAWAYLLVVAATWELSRVLLLLLAYAHFALVASALPRLSRFLRNRVMTRGAVFAICASAFLVFPGLIWPTSSSTRSDALILGWDFMLAAYSYVVDTARKAETPSRADCLFFVLVNPTLVYARRGVRVGAPSWDGRTVVRAAFSALMLFVAFAMLEPVISHLRERLATSTVERAVVPFVGLGAVAFLCEYARQSGLASFQIAVFRQLGYQLPERFLWPIAATSPVDFWRRWNTYVGTWMLRYVFWPVAFRHLRHDRRRLRQAQALAVLVTFAAIGILHDAFAYVHSYVLEARALAGLGVNGLAVVAWAALGVWMSRHKSAKAGPGAIATRAASAIAFWALTITLCALWLK